MRKKTLNIRKSEIFTVISKGYKKEVTGRWIFKKIHEIFPEILIYVKGQLKPWIVEYKTEDEMIKELSDFMSELENKSTEFIDLSKFFKE